MSRCIRNGVSYKRHQFKPRFGKGICGACLAIKKPKSAKAIARKANKNA